MIIKKTYRLLCLLLIISGCYRGYSQSPDAISFIANKGQWDANYQYQAALPGGGMWVTKDGFMYCYTSEADMEAIEAKWEQGLNVDSEKLHGHWYKVNFKGHNEYISYSGSEQRSWYYNLFHGNDSSRWRGHVPLYGSVKMSGVYDNIDAVLYTKDRALKYDWVVHASGDPDAIRMQYDGVSPIIDNNGNLHITTNVNEVTEVKPYAYQVINGDTITVPCHYALNNNEVSFSFPEGYDTTKDLIIDPQLIFVTYSGGGPFRAGYFSFCSTYDKNGNFYAAGVPLRGFFWVPNPLWPTTPGAFQENWTTIYEPMVCINKYDATGSNLVFSTYYGGGGPSDIPHAMVCNDADELILAGSTGSFNLPVTSGCFDSTKSGGTDMYVAHFTEDGSNLIGATYIGGNLGNSINAIDIYSTSGFTSQNKLSPVEITLDSVGNIWAVTNTSTIDFPVTGNAAQPNFGGGNCDGVALGITADCTQMLYGTYIGGSNTDVAYCIRLNSAGNLVICGGTRSSNFPISDGAYMGTPAGSGDWDGYAAIINPVTGNLLHSTYLGTNEDDQATNLQVDKNDNVYVLGRTFGNYPVSDGVYNLPQGDIFIDKLAPDLGTSLLSTRMGYHQGSDTSFFPTAFLLDNCEHIYVLGLSFSTKVLALPGDPIYQGYPLQGMPLTPDAFQTTPAPFWFGVLNPDFEGLLYASYMGRAGDVAYDDIGQPYYYGGDHTHVGTYRLDPHGLLYQSICSGSLYYPGTTSNSWSPYNQNSYINGSDTGVVGQDIVSFKFRFDLSGTDAGTITINGNDSGCAPYTLQFSSITYAAQTNYWDFGDGATSTEASPTHTYTQPGTYHIMLAIHNDTVICKNDDTTYKTITIFDPHVPDLIAHDTLLCDSVNQVAIHVTLTNPGAFGNSYQWQSIGGGGGIIGANNLTAVVNPNIDTLYRITVWDTMPGFCGYSASDTIHIDYKPRKLSVSPEDTLICKGQGITITTNGTTGYSYNWTPTTGVLSPTDQNPIITPDSTTQYTVTASYPGCADTAQSITIRIDDPANSSFTLLDDSICTGQYIRVLASIPDSTANSFRWSFGDGSYIDINNISDTMRHAYDTAGNLVVTLQTHFRACPDSAYVDTVHVFPLPVVNLGGDTSICANGTPIALENKYSNTDIRSMEWSTGVTTPWLKVTEPGIYSLTVRTEPIGCANTDEIIVKKDCYIDIPNVFSPNNDGVNDYFFPRQLLTKSLTQFKMQILNRWGQVIFETTNIDGRGWDGKFNNVDQPAGVYVYQIDATISNEGVQHYQGNVTLVR